MSFSELELKRIEKDMFGFMKKRRPPAEIRDKVDLAFKIEKYSIIIFEIRPVWNDPSRLVEIPVAKTTFVKAKKNWKIFWQRADLKWHKYDPFPEVNSFSEFLSMVDKDRYGCSWG
jgi:hypothetical protein